MHPFLTRKSEGRWVSGISETKFPILLWKTGSRLRGNCCGYWKTFRGPFIPENMEKIGKNWG